MSISTPTHTPYGIIQVSMYMSICSLIFILTIGFYMQNIWKSDWEKHRCDILALPFANYINPKESVVQNFNYCLKKKTDPMIKAIAQKKLNDAANAAAKETKKTEKLFDSLMGKKADSRYNFIQENANFINNLDV